MNTPPRLLVIFSGALVLVVAAIVALATGLWWLLPLALVIHLTVFAGAMGPVAKALGQGDKPDPVTDARLEEEGRESGLGLTETEQGDGLGQRRAR